MFKRENVIGTIGVVAFIIGGIITRANVIEGIETLEKTFKKDKKEPIETAI